MGIYEVYPNELIEKAAEELKKNEAIKPPVWAGFVKTGAHKERAPVDKDWWYKRAASILRSIQILGPIGVSKLRIKYGGKKRRGHKPSHFKKGSGNIIRKALQQLEKAGFVKFAEKGLHKGRIITKEGKLFLNKIAEEIMKSKGVEIKKEHKPVEKKEEVKKEKPKATFVTSKKEEEKSGKEEKGVKEKTKKGSKTEENKK